MQKSRFVMIFRLETNSVTFTRSGSEDQESRQAIGRNLKRRQRYFYPMASTAQATWDASTPTVLCSSLTASKT